MPQPGVTVAASSNKRGCGERGGCRGGRVRAHSAGRRAAPGTRRRPGTRRNRCGHRAVRAGGRSVAARPGRSGAGVWHAKRVRPGQQTNPLWANPVPGSQIPPGLLGGLPVRLDGQRQKPIPPHQVGEHPVLGPVETAGGMHRLAEPHHLGLTEAHPNPSRRRRRRHTGRARLPQAEARPRTCPSPSETPTPTSWRCSPP